MEINDTVHSGGRYRCRLCGQHSPMSATHCSNPGCGAQLHLHGEMYFDTEEGELLQAAPPAPAETTVQSPEEDTPSPDRGKAKKSRNPWRLATIVTAVVSLAIILTMGHFWYVAQADYYRTHEKLGEVWRQCNDLLDYIHDNGLELLYQVEIAEIYNSDDKGNKIDENLTAATMDQLCIALNLTTVAIDNKWEDPLEITLLFSGETVANWTIDTKNSSYTDESDSAYFRTWLKVTTPGTYTAEFRHKGSVVLRQEITIE